MVGSWQAAGRWAPRDGPGGLGQERGGLHGHRGPALPLLGQEGGGPVSGRPGAAERSDVTASHSRLYLKYVTLKSSDALYQDKIR